ncbi:MAG: hypothetical protein WDZ42_00720 [Candidatus Saccharimonadales bacterium]
MMLEWALVLLGSVIVAVLVWAVRHLIKQREQSIEYSGYINELHQDIIKEVLSKDFLGQLQNQAQLQLASSIQVVDKELKESLRQANQQLIDRINDETTTIINTDLETYRQTIVDANSAAASLANKIQAGLEEASKEIQARVEDTINKERNKINTQIDTKLADVITEYLIEALGEEVDLGSQKNYIIEQLEERKEDIKKDVNDEF